MQSNLLSYGNCMRWEAIRGIRLAVLAAVAAAVAAADVAAGWGAADAAAAGS